MLCPRCQHNLATIEYEHIKIETCPNCQGEWLDEGELKQIVQTRQAHFTVEELRTVTAATKIKGVNLNTLGRQVLCPKCITPTDPINYGGDTGILIDRCRSCHGIWLDATELEKIQMLVESWDDGLDEDLSQYGAKLRQVADTADERDNVRVSRFRFVNSIINGILDVAS